jgi:hypothetical protein
VGCVSDLFRFLPLSNRTAKDESDVSSNWARQTGTALLQIADILDELTPDQWDVAALRDEFTVRTTVGHLVWWLGDPRTARRAEFLRTASTRERIEVEASRAAATASPADLIQRVRSLSVDFLAPNAKATIREVSVAVVDAYDIAYSTGRTVHVDELASGAVALARSLEGPYVMRAVLGERTLKASDADWKVGFGPELKGTAGAIVLFLWQRHGLPDD